MTAGTGSRRLAGSWVAPSWVAAEFGIEVADGGSPVGLTMTDLIEVGLRRNPRRAQLLVSTVLGKHLAADPRVVAGLGRLLGALVDLDLRGPDRPVPEAWVPAVRAAVAGEPDPLLGLLDAAAGPIARPDGALTLGFAETATALGHLVADQLGSDYLHSTRRRDGAVRIAAEFSEPHSHATGHLLRPDPPGLLDGRGVVVLVDDELSTGRTALNVIAALHAIARRDRYVLAGLVDVRSAADDENRAALADRLGCRIDVVSLVRGSVTVPTGTVHRVSAELAARPDPIGAPARLTTAPAPPPRCSRVDLPWPADPPTGGRHGFRPADRVGFDAAVRVAAATLASACGAAARVLVLGTEELMYLPLRLALELSRNPLRAIAFQSTTRSPVHAIDRPGYPIRRRIDFRSSVIGTAEPVDRHVYNIQWPASDLDKHLTEAAFAEAELIVVVDDGHAVPGTDGVAESIAAATGVPVLLAVLHPRPGR